MYVLDIIHRHQYEVMVKKSANIGFYKTVYNIH